LDRPYNAKQTALVFNNAVPLEFSRLSPNKKIAVLNNRPAIQPPKTKLLVFLLFRRIISKHKTIKIKGEKNEF